MGVYDCSQAQELDLESVNSSRGYFCCFGMSWMSNCSHPIGDFHLMIFQFAGILGVKDSLLNELTKLYEQNKTRLQVWFGI
jgi:hypothetical protein